MERPFHTAFVRPDRFRFELANLLSEDTLDGARCLRVQGRRGDDPLTIWVDADTHLIRRIDTSHRFGDVRTETTTSYEPVLDQDIAADALVFGAPVPAAAPPTP